MSAADPLAEIRAAMSDPNVHLRLVRLVFGASGWAVQIYVKSRKVGPLLLPPEGGTVLDTLTLLDAIEAEGR